MNIWRELSIHLWNDFIFIHLVQGFFRRSIQKQIEYRCLRDGKCLVIRLNRNRCQYCRFKKCLAVGMSRDCKYFFVNIYILFSLFLCYQLGNMLFALFTLYSSLRSDTKYIVTHIWGNSLLYLPTLRTLPVHWHLDAIIIIQFAGFSMVRNKKKLKMAREKERKKNNENRKRWIFDNMHSARSNGSKMPKKHVKCNKNKEWQMEKVSLFFHSVPLQRSYLMPKLYINGCKWNFANVLCMWLS